MTDNEGYLYYTYWVSFLQCDSAISSHYPVSAVSLSLHNSYHTAASLSSHLPFIFSHSLSSTFSTSSPSLWYIFMGNYCFQFTVSLVLQANWREFVVPNLEIYFSLSHTAFSSKLVYFRQTCGTACLLMSFTCYTYRTIWREC